MYPLARDAKAMFYILQFVNIFTDFYILKAFYGIILVKLGACDYYMDPMRRTLTPSCWEQTNTVSLLRHVPGNGVILLS